ncbi:hydroxymethylbilane synthase [Sapientia aquatica]|uniref:Porphobilinogen deaminase n=1 Tax=Sapientia aquatica TaxID=1549640 RepID=A0A4R5W545_9BURK|nr:hydroxymethylbilane synthase [Sapientia aquatica]TDK68231.1 hydroxymethylbilane synthase [Sapientia aquatica]
MTTSLPKKLIIATRESRLAMWQAQHVQARLQSLYPDCVIELLGMTTRGDQILDRTLSKVGGKGLFVKELETAMLDGRADMAVHSLKDMPMDVPEGLQLTAVLEREDPRDAFVSNDFAALNQLPAGAVVGTSSLRRQAALMAQFPHLNIKPLRGNLDTRLRKLDQGEYAAIILAAAGLKRLGLPQRIRSYIEPEESLPSAGQGAMAIEIADNNPELAAWLAPLNDLTTAQAVHAERAVSKAFGGSCQIPLAAHAVIDGAQMRLRAFIALPDGTKIVRAEASGPSSQGAELSAQVVKQLQQQDAAAILAQCLAETAQA